LQEQQTSITANGIKFQGLQRGNTPQLILLHGFACDLHTYDSLYQAINPTYSTLRYDLRGFGQSVDCCKTPFSHSEDLLAIMDTLNIDQCALMGASMGGATAINFALNHPARVSQLILLSPALVAWEWSESWRNMWREITTLARAGKLDEARARWWNHPLFESTRQSAAAETFYQSTMGYSGDQWIKEHQINALPDIERLHELSVATLLLSGGLDLPDFRLIADVLQSSVLGITRVDFPSLGHLLYLEDPAACAAKINNFMGES